LGSPGVVVVVVPSYNKGATLIPLQEHTNDVRPTKETNSLALLVQDQFLNFAQDVMDFPVPKHQATYETQFKQILETV
jgi:hypothetical protein